MGPSSVDRSFPVESIDAIDARFSTAGLVRCQRRKPAERTRQSRLERTEPEALAYRLPVPRRAVNGVEWLQAPGWATLPWLWSGFSTRRGGLSQAYCSEDAPSELNLGFTAADDRQTVVHNRRLFADAVTGDPETPIIALRQFHSNHIVQTVAADALRDRPQKADGQMTDEPGLLLAIQTADCIPVLVADRRLRAVAAFHAGWRGTVKRIVECGIGRMRLAFGSRPEDLAAAIGPGIGPCCYAVGDEVLSEFESQFSYGRELFREVSDSDAVRRKYPRLPDAARAGSFLAGSQPARRSGRSQSAATAGGRAEACVDKIVGGCTQCHTEMFFSHRASHGHAGRMMAVIGIREAANNRPRGSAKKNTGS